MFCPLTNTSTRVCNRAIVEIFTVSEELVSCLRLVLQSMCEDSFADQMPSLEHYMKKYCELNHTMNSLPKAIIRHVERHLDMILRPDPTESDGTNVCRV